MKGNEGCSPVFKMGNVSFTVENCAQSFLQQLQVVLPQSDGDEPEEHIYKVQLTEEDDLRSLMNRIFKQHPGNLWIDAACLVAPGGNRLLLAGRSSAGKSTTAMALATGYAWKVLSEDLTLFDLQNNQVLKFATPFSLKSGTKELLQETVGVDMNPILFGEWSSALPYAAAGHIDAQLDVAIYLEKTQTQDPLKVSPLSVHEYIRKLLPCSNIIRLPDAAEKLAEYLGSGSCFNIEGGSLSDRLQLIQEMCK